MYTKLFRSALFPALDVLNGTRITRILKTLEQTEWWPKEQLLDLQRHKLRLLLAWTSEHSRFYEHLWRSETSTACVSSEYPELDGLPLVKKEDFRSATNQFPIASFRGRLRGVQTSGSTGVPMTFVRSMEQESWFWAIRIRMWQWAGYRLGRPYLAVNLNTRAGRKRLQDLFFRCSYLTYNVANQDSKNIVEHLRSRRIEHINGFASSVTALARYMDRHGIGNPGTVRGISVTGDNLFSADRALIDRVFGVRTIDYYGAGGEGVHLASQCERADRYHLHPENAVVEVIVDDRPARPGETGRIVVTQLDNYAMPLIRYDLGDLATVDDGTPCPCGRQSPLLRSIDGRACDVVLVPDGSRLLPQFFFIGAFKTLENVEQYQVIQDRVDRVTIRLVDKPGCDRRRSEATLVAAIASVSRGLLGVDFEWVGEIPLVGRGKPRPVISLLEQPTPAVKAEPAVGGL